LDRRNSVPLVTGPGEFKNMFLKELSQQWRYDVGQNHSQMTSVNSPTLVYSGAGILCYGNENILSL
jgi:hypothetical protein